MTKFFVSPRTGEQIAVEPLRMVNKNGKYYSLKLYGKRGRDKKTRRMHINSLRNLRWNKSGAETKR